MFQDPLTTDFVPEQVRMFASRHDSWGAVKRTFGFEIVVIDISEKDLKWKVV